jgi:Spy/CpxP family protein refolding chaperone
MIIRGFVTLGLLAAMAGCSGEAANTQSTALSAQQPQTQNEPPKDRPHHGHRPHHGGPDFLLMAALHEPINLTAAQKTTIEDAMKEARPKGPPPSMASLAAGIRAGKVEAPPIDQARIDASAKALATLHATLTKEQRAQLVEAVSKHKPHGPPREHRPMGHMLEGLDLTKEQEEKIRAALEAQKPNPVDMEARLQSFAADSFDARAFATPPQRPNELQVVVSLLTQAQREKLAARIEQGPPGHRK